MRRLWIKNPPRWLCDRVMAMVFVFEDDVLRLVCGYATPSENSFKERNVL